MAKADWNLKHWMHWCECHSAVFQWKNMDWAIIFDTWKSTKNQKALPLELDDDQAHYVGNLNNLSTSFQCMYFFNIVRHHIIFIFNTKWPISSCFFGEVLQKTLESLSEVWFFRSPSHWNACAHFKVEHCWQPPTWGPRIPPTAILGTLHVATPTGFASIILPNSSPATCFQTLLHRNKHSMAPPQQSRNFANPKTLN